MSDKHVPVMVEHDDPEASLADFNLTEWEAHDAANAAAIEAMASRVQKGISRVGGKGARRRAELVSRLKRRRKYRNPVRGGTGKQTRSRRTKF